MAKEAAFLNMIEVFRANKECGSAFIFVLDPDLLDDKKGKNIYHFLFFMTK